MASVNKVILARLYLEEQKSIPDISKALDIGLSATRKALIDAGIPLRSRTEGVRAASRKLGHQSRGKTRVFSDEWKANIRAARLRHAEENAAGLSYKSGGYVEITRGPNKGRGQHVILIEGVLGRRLRRDKVVHHRDENKHNNSICNLELMTRSEHAKHHRAEAKNGKR